MLSSDPRTELRQIVGSENIPHWFGGPATHDNVFDENGIFSFEKMDANQKRLAGLWREKYGRDDVV